MIESLKKWLEVYVRYQFAYSDGLAMRLVYEALRDDDTKKIWEVDRLITVQAGARESREVTKMVGQRMIKTYLELYDVPLLKKYEKRVKEKKFFGHPALVTAILMNSMDIPFEEALICHMYSSVSTLIQNGVRAIPLGQKDGLILMQDFFTIFKEVVEEVKKLDQDDFGANIPGLEIAQINHENLTFRLFMS